MSSKSPRVYADSCCFIEAVKYRRKLPLSVTADVLADRELDCWFFRRLCDASRDGAITLVTSMLSVAECIHAEENGGPARETKNLFIEFLTSGTVVELIEPDLFVMERARDLFWNDAIKLSGADGIHVATAILENCSEFVTLDNKIGKTKFAAAIPLIGGLGLKVVRPRETSRLPNDYRIEDMFGDTTDP
jgi:predicted nucleic acid-binding protein